MCPARYRAGGSLLHCLSTLTKSSPLANFGNLLRKFPHGTFGARGGIFLLHWPWSCLHRTLSGILPCEARTFLTCRFLRPALGTSWREQKLPGAASCGSRDHLSYLILWIFYEFIGQTANHFVIHSILYTKITSPNKLPANGVGRDILAVYSLEILQKLKQPLGLIVLRLRLWDSEQKRFHILL